MNSFILVGTKISTLFRNNPLIRWLIYDKTKRSCEAFSSLSTPVPSFVPKSSHANKSHTGTVTLYYGEHQIASWIRLWRDAEFDSLGCMLQRVEGGAAIDLRVCKTSEQMQKNLI